MKLIRSTDQLELFSLSIRCWCFNRSLWAIVILRWNSDKNLSCSLLSQFATQSIGNLIIISIISLHSQLTNITWQDRTKRLQLEPRSKSIYPSVGNLSQYSTWFHPRIITITPTIMTQRLGPKNLTNIVPVWIIIQPIITEITTIILKLWIARQERKNNSRVVLPIQVVGINI